MLTYVLSDLGALADGSIGSLSFGPRLRDEMAAALELTRRACEWLADPSTAAPPAGADVPLTPACHDVLRLSLRQLLFGPRSLVADRPLPALLGAAVRMAVAVWTARARAAPAAAGPADLSRGHSLAARLLEVPAAAAVLVQHEDLAASILEGMALVV
jgi:hypothetical protein